MGYAQYLQWMLSPLGVYNLEEESVSGAAIAALGDALDEVWHMLQDSLRDAFPQRAGEEAITQWEGILPVHPRPETLAQRQQALAFLLSRGSVSCSAADVEKALAACGIMAEVDEITNAPKMTIRVATAGLSSEQQADLHLFLRSLVPAHLHFSIVEE